MRDYYTLEHSPVHGPASKWKAITPDDAADLPNVPKGIFVGGAGNLALVGEDGNPETFQNVAAGVVYPFRAVRVLSTGTTATGLKALY